MNRSNTLFLASRFILLVCFVIISSLAVTAIWQPEQEGVPQTLELIYRPDMSVSEFAESNHLSNEILQSVFQLTSATELNRQLQEFSIDKDSLSKRLEQAKALEAEHASKNWQKIVLKFSLWFLVLAVVFRLLRSQGINPFRRKWLYFLALVIFGVILGSDPSPMGTVKDAIMLFATKQVVFPPRMIALGLFLLTVFLANKFICAWGCQVGVLQDLIFRLNRDRKDRKGMLRQFKLPFVVSNGFRILFFMFFIGVAVVWSLDSYHPLDPFRLYKPAVIAVSGWIFLGMLLLASLFVYRPWCTLFCPFGLVGWVVEKVSIFKISVDYTSCTACESCAKACPTTVMEAILKQQTVIPDCFSCGVCLETCPTHSISFKTGKRQQPPAGKFTESSSTPST